MPGPMVLAPFLLALFSRGAVPAPAAPPATPARPFEMGSVDLVSLAAALPSAEVAGATAPLSGSPTSLRGLREIVERFLEEDVKRAVSGAQLRESGARWNSVTGGAAGPRSASLVQRTVQDAVSPPRSFGGDGWAGLLSALIPASAAALSFNPALGEARSCLTFLESFERRVRSFRDGLPANDETAAPELVRQWERLSAELRANVSCRGRGSR